MKISHGPRKKVVDLRFLHPFIALTTLSPPRHPGDNGPKGHTGIRQEWWYIGRRGRTMADGFTIANFRHVANGLQEGQFAVGDKRKATSLNDLAPIYRQLLDEPVTMTLAVIGPDGRPSLTPMWFDHSDGEVLVNTASHRNKCQWIRANPQLSVLLVNPKNAYHWVQIKCTVRRELREWDEGGDYVTKQTDRIWTK